jgi:hypothetical protein
VGAKEKQTEDDQGYAKEEAQTAMGANQPEDVTGVSGASGAASRFGAHGFCPGVSGRPAVLSALGAVEPLAAALVGVLICADGRHVMAAAEGEAPEI